MLFDGLSPIVCGVLGYVSIILYDLNNTSHNNDRMQSLHTVGAGLIGLAFFNPVLPGLSEANSLPTAVRVIAGYSLFGTDLFVKNEDLDRALSLLAPEDGTESGEEEETGETDEGTDE